MRCFSLEVDACAADAVGDGELGGGVDVDVAERCDRRPRRGRVMLGAWYAWWSACVEWVSGRFARPVQVSGLVEGIGYGPLVQSGLS